MLSRHREEPTVAEPHLPVDEREDTLLAVVSGPRAGARRPLVDGERLSIGFDLGCDVVIRHPSLLGLRATLIQEGEDVRLQVEQGQVNLLGMTLPAGRSVVLPRWVPFALGDAMLAVGSARGRGWSACRRLANQLAQERAIEPDAADALPDATEPGEGDPAPVLDARGGPPSDEQARQLSRNWQLSSRAAARGRRLAWQVPLGMAGCLMLALSVAWLAPMVGAVASAPQGSLSERLRAVLRDHGHGHLKVEQGAATPVVRGFVDTDSQRAQIADLVTRAGTGASVELTSGQHIVRQVSDVFRVNGLPAQVRHVGRGVIEAEVGVADPERVRRAEAIVRRDVPGIAGLEIRFTPAPKAPAVKAPLVPDDPGKRVVSVAYGPNGHVVTADGARYFVGAVLPTGHRIMRIAEGEVELMRDGQTTRLAI